MKKEDIVIELRNLYFKVESQSVISSNVDKVKWDSVSKQLTIKFDNGSVYTYFNVPEKIYNNIVDGQASSKIGSYPSVGAAVHQYLIQGNYKYRKG
jgi:hypothetical protein